MLSSFQGEYGVLHDDGSGEGGKENEEDVDDGGDAFYIDFAVWFGNEC